MSGIVRMSIAGLTLGLGLCASASSALAGNTISVTGSVVDTQGRPLAGIHVFACDARGDVKAAYGEAVYQGADRPKRTICGTDLYQDAVTRSDGSFALVASPAVHLIVAAGGEGYVREPCMYRAIPDDSLQLKFILYPAERGRADNETMFCPAAPRPGSGETTKQYFM